VNNESNFVELVFVVCYGEDHEVFGVCFLLAELWTWNLFILWCVKLWW